MSEYQYYEFQAIDRPLTKQDMAEVRALSTRATITPTRFVNVYHWGDFKGDPLALMQRYYDAFLYAANWGSHRLMLRLPRSALEPETALSYAVERGPISVHLVREHLILFFASEADEPEAWDWEEDEDEGWLSMLVPLRADIAAGDLRSLYLGWLLCVQEDLLDDYVVEPPVPPGLLDLSASLQGLAEFLRLEDDLLRAAAEGSPAMPDITPPPDKTRQWLRDLSEAEKDDLLLRLACGDVPLLQAEVRRHIRGSGIAGSTGGVARRGRTVEELLAEAERKKMERVSREAQEQVRRLQEQAAARSAYLEGLAERQEEIWRQVEALVEAKRKAEYAEAVRLLTDLSDLERLSSQGVGSFGVRLKDLRTRHGRKTSFLDCLKQAGL